jgi:hypothetical protein
MWRDDDSDRAGIIQAYVNNVPKMLHLTTTKTFEIDYIVEYIDPLLGRDLETNNVTTAVAMQRHSKHSSTTIKLLLETVL